MVYNAYSDQMRAVTAGDFMYKVYGWMAAALAISAGTAWYIYQTPAVFSMLMQNGYVVFSIFIGQLLLASVLSLMISRLSFPVAALLFVAYSILTGITLSSIFFVYDIHSIYLVFAITSIMFATMALYGYFTKADLTSIGNVAFMMLIGLIVGGLINMFFKSAMFDYILTLAGVGIFTILTAVDMQKLKQLGMTLYAQGESGAKVAVLGAFILYLDFINLFLMLLRLVGKRKD